MKTIVRIAGILIVLAIITLEARMYWSHHLLMSSMKQGDSEKGLELLDKAARSYPFNDQVFFQKGMLLYNMGAHSMGDLEKSTESLQAAVRNYKRAVRLNPASQFAHFHLARALKALDLTASDESLNYTVEYTRAAALVSESSDIYFEVGVDFLSRWNQLEKIEQNDTLAMLKNIWDVERPERVSAILQTWDLNVGDYSVIHGILPSHPVALRQYADYLGRRSLSMEERLEALAEAEVMDFEGIRSLFVAAENDLYYYRLEEAAWKFASCISRLNRIAFYQNLVQRQLIESEEYLDLRRASYLNRIKARVEDGAGWKDIFEELLNYLDNESRVTEIRELEQFFIDEGIIEEKESSDYRDLDRLAFRMGLWYKQNHYNEIIRIGRSIRGSVLLVSPEKNASYIRIMNHIGDAFNRSGYYYDAADFYANALEKDQRDLATLTRVRRNYQNLDDRDALEEVDSRINLIITTGNLLSEAVRVSKGGNYYPQLVLDGGKYHLRIETRSNPGEQPPLISVFFNGRVLWDGFFENDELLLLIDSKIGSNHLRINAVNQAVRLQSLSLTIPGS